MINLLPRMAMALLLVLSSLWIVVSSAQAQTDAAHSVFGRWKTIDDETDKAKSIVEIYQQQGKLYGKVAEILSNTTDNPDPVCKKCSDARKDQKILGMVIIDGLTQESDGNTWSGGEILDPAKGKTYTCKLWLDDGQLKVRGYVGIFSALKPGYGNSKRQSWIRVIPNPIRN